MLKEYFSLKVDKSNVHLYHLKMNSTVLVVR